MAVCYSFLRPSNEVYDGDGWMEKLWDLGSGSCLKNVVRTDVARNINNATPPKQLYPGKKTTTVVPVDRVHSLRARKWREGHSWLKTRVRGGY